MMTLNWIKPFGLQGLFKIIQRLKGLNGAAIANCVVKWTINMLLLIGDNADYQKPCSRNSVKEHFYFCLCVALFYVQTQ